jgi:ABC-type amino acid transport substrate-binding protein
MVRAVWLALAASILAGGADAGVLDRVRDNGTFNIGFRADTQPFSYKNDIGEPAGYSVELCRAVAAEVKAALNLPELKVNYVELGPEERFDAVTGGKVDLLCSADSISLTRRQTVDFSLMTFASGMTLLYRVDGPQGFEGLAGTKIGALEGTTTLDLLKKALQTQAIDAELVPVTSHEDGVQRLAGGELSAYFGDGAILLYQWLLSPERDRLKLSDRFLSHEPYGLVMARGDDDFRLVVDRTLAELYRSGEIAPLFAATFGRDAKPSPLVQAIYALNALPE